MEREHLSPRKTLLRHLPRTWLIIREFETMLYDDQDHEGNYNGVELHLSRPRPSVHRSRRPPQSARRTCWTRTTSSSATHRSHSEILAKGLSCDREARRQGAVLRSWRSFFGGEILKADRRQARRQGRRQGAGDGLLALRRSWQSCLPRTTGFNRGLGGSMHAFFLPFGIYPEQRHRGRLRADRHRASRSTRRCNQKKGMVVCQRR